MRIHDITRPLNSDTPVWPGDAPFRLCWSMRMDRGAAANVAESHGSVHCGTHVDAPFHVAPQGARVADLPPEVFVGPAVVVDVAGRSAIGREVVDRVLAIGRVERVLFRTGCWTDPAVFPERFAALDPAEAERLRDAGVRLVGTDAPSVDPFDSASLPAHRVLCEAGIPILENLWLDGFPPGAGYELIALPLRMVEADASPVRAVLRAP